MSDEMQVDPGRLHEAGSAVDAANEELRAVKPTAESGLGSGWSPVESAITAGVQGAGESLSGLAGHAQSWSDAIHSSADRYTAQEQDNSAALGRGGDGGA